jgi:hypothetical protein
MIACEGCDKIYRVPAPRLHCQCGQITEVPKGKRDELLRKSKGKPGTELEKLIPKFFASEGCGCKSYVRKMDRWGVIGCESRFDEIVEFLCEQAKAKPIVKRLGLVNRIVAAHWVNKAIENTKSNSAQ